VGQKEHPTSNIQHPTSNLPLTPALSPSDGEREVPRAGPGEGWRRAALARWITDPKNLLTRRSIVNRVWHYHFGRGLVETPNDFGHMGALPTHPELLDWLAFWFQDNGESLKQLHRLMVTSAAYRQSSSTASGSGDTEKGKRRKGAEETVSSAPPPLFPSATVATRRAIEIDADNRYLWRMNRARLDAETVHDSMLLISGKLDPTMGGPAVQQFYFKDDHSPIYDYTQFDADSPAACRRSIYRFIVRSVPDPLMESLDCPDASLLAPKRNVTVTALQALAILNNPFVLKQCEHLAKRVAVERESRPSGRRAGLPARSGSDSRATSDFSRRASASESAAAEDSRAPDARRANAGDLKSQIERVYQLALNRQPTAAELEKLVPFAEKHGLANACRVIFNSSEFIFVD